MRSRIDLRDLLECSSAAKTTSSGDTWMPTRIVYLSRDGGILWLSVERAVEATLSSLR